MTTVQFSLTTEVPPDRFINALTDFSERRSSWWPNLDPHRFQVHALGPTTAQVTEGASFAGGIWERGTYDWSTPGVVRFDVEESNAFAAGSFWEYRVSPDGSGALIEVTIRRVPRTTKARFIAVLLSVFGRRVFRKDLQRTLSLLAGTTETQGRTR